MSGLGTAALLGKSGMKVLVLEKHSTAGGACHTFDDNGYEFNVGINYVGEMDNPAFPPKIILDQVSDGQIQWAPLGKHLNIYFCIYRFHSFLSSSFQNLISTLFI